MRVGLEGTRRGTARSKKYWREVVIQDMMQLQVTEDVTLDRKECRVVLLRIVGVCHSNSCFIIVLVFSI